MTRPVKHKLIEEYKGRWVQLLGEIWDKTEHFLNSEELNKRPPALYPLKYRGPGVGMGRMYKESYANTYAAMNVRIALEKLINVLQPPNERKQHTPRNGQKEQNPTSQHPLNEVPSLPRPASEPSGPNLDGYQTMKQGNSPDVASHVEEQRRNSGSSACRSDYPCTAERKSPTEEKKDDDKNSITFYSCKESSSPRAPLHFSRTGTMISHSSRDSSSNSALSSHKKKVGFTSPDYPTTDGVTGSHIPPLLHDKIWKKSLRMCNEHNKPQTPPSHGNTPELHRSHQLCDSWNGTPCKAWNSPLGGIFFPKVYQVQSTPHATGPLPPPPRPTRSNTTGASYSDEFKNWG